MMYEHDSLNARFNTIYPQEILYNAVQIFGNRLAVLAHFKPADIVILHMLSAIAPQVAVLTLESNEQSPLISEMVSRLSLNIIQVGAVPFNRSHTEYDAWLVGQTAPAQKSSATVPVLAYTSVSHRVRIAPLAFWTQATVYAYLREHQLPGSEDSSMPPARTRV
jgi:3'-phosphoadenosine 5'-phosphosulfate sulfotransferase (PAPS reductase)/FAD synthetase